VSEGEQIEESASFPTILSFGLKKYGRINKTLKGEYYGNYPMVE
jgi:hypothetical protein